MTDHPLHGPNDPATSWAFNPWRPMSRPIDLKHLGKLGEELNEAGTAVSRCIIQGIVECEPVTRKPNREWLEDELADVTANIELVTLHFGLDRDRMAKRAERKKAHLRGWHSMEEGGLAYLATPYSKYQGGNIGQAFRDAAEIAAMLLRAGVKVYSPICHIHPIAIHGDIDPLDLTIWLPFDQAMLAACDILIVAHMDGWQESQGIAEEIKFFEQRRKPIFDLNIETLQMTRRGNP